MLNMSVKQQSDLIFLHCLRHSLKLFLMSYFYPNAWKKKIKIHLNELIYEHSYWLLTCISFFVFLSWMKDIQSMNFIGSKNHLSYISCNHRDQRQTRLIGSFNSSPYCYRTVQSIYSTLFCPTQNNLVYLGFESAQKTIPVSHQSYVDQDQLRQPAWTDVVTAQQFVCTVTKIQ